MLTGGQTQIQSNPAEIQVESSQPQAQPQELQWEPVQFQNFGNILRRDFLTVSMNKFIVLFSKVVSGKVKLSLLDPEKKAYHLVEAPTDPLSDLEKLVACYWEENKIIVMGHKVVEVPGGFIAKSFETQIYLGIITFLETTNGFVMEHQRIPQNEIQTTNQHFTYHYTMNTIKNVLYVSFGGYGSQSHFAMRIYRFDLETFKPAPLNKNISEWSVKSQTSFVYDNDFYVYYKTEATSSIAEKAACIKLDASGTITSTAIPNQNLLCSPDFQFETSSGSIYGFANSSEKADYTTLHIYDIDADYWDACTIKGDGSDLQNKKLMALIGSQIYVIDRSAGILSLDLSDLARVHKKKPEVNPLSMEPLNKAALAKIFFKQAPYSDVVFEVESQLIRAHRWWLIKRSKYFANMFSSGMMEAKSERIVISDMKATTFRAFLEFLYTDNVQLNETRALELFEQADKYSVPALTKLCEEYLCSCVNSDNYVKIAQLAELLDVSMLREATVTFISNNVKKLKERKDFAGISDQMLRDVILKITIR